MELIILGSGTCVPSLTRGSPGLLVRVGDKRVVVDTGSGSLTRLLRAGVSYNDIDQLYYTHTHPDHTADLVPYLFACNYGDAPRRRGLQIIAGKGFGRFFDDLREVYQPWMEPQQYQLNLSEVGIDRLDFKDFSLITRPMKHTELSVGYRVQAEDGKSVTISGDTDYCQNIIELAQETNLLVLECSFPSQHKLEGHLSPKVAGQIAQEANCQRLLLTHFYPVCDQYDIIGECRTTYAGELILAEDGMRLIV